MIFHNAVFTVIASRKRSNLHKHRTISCKIASVLRSKAAAENGAASRQGVTRNDGFSWYVHTDVHYMNNHGPVVRCPQ